MTGKNIQRFSERENRGKDIRYRSFTIFLCLNSGVKPLFLHQRERFVNEAIMKRRIAIHYILFLGSVFVCLLAGNVFAQGNIMNMRHFIAPDSTRVVFDLTEPPVYETVQKDNMLTILLKQTTCAEAVPKETKLRKSGIDSITITTLKEGDVRVQMKLKSDMDVHINVFDLKPFQNRPDRLVIDAELPEVSRQETHLREQAKVLKKKKVIIVDPGHGGDDPGAIGGRGTYEKDIVLAISRHIKKLLDGHELFQAYLTRDGDYYVPFDKRLRIAREYGADLFISVHADAAKNREARGSSVYCLATAETSSVAAKIVAQSENLADISGGVRKTTAEASNPILINMHQTNTINVSKEFGKTVLGELGQIGELKFKKVQEAPFIVLKMPEIPSVLIETAFISNAEEEKKLREPEFREKIAAAVARAVIDFFASSPSDPGQSERKERAFFSYTVEKGDTLTNIAARFGLPLQTLLQDNALDVHAALHVGRRLKIEVNERSAKERNVLGSPAVSKSVAEKLPGTEVKNKGANITSRYYVVEKGDTLTKIAERFGADVHDILADNKLRKDDPLYVGKRLKINTGEKGTGKTAPENRSSVKAATKPPPVAETTKGAKKKVSYYTVKRGDSLAKIAEHFGVTVKDLLDSNGMKTNDSLHVGRRLKIEKEELPVKTPPNQKQKSGEKQKIVYKTYQVKKGDRLSDIAQKHGVPVSVLLKLNNMKLNDPLHAGRILRVAPANAP